MRLTLKAPCSRSQRARMMHMTITIEPHERYDLFRSNPADLIAADDEARERVDALLAPLRSSWTSAAACLDVALDVFFPGPGHRNDAALAVCGRCPVRQQCLDEAIADPDLDFGVRGGADVAARQLMRRNRLASARSSTEELTHAKT